MDTVELLESATANLVGWHRCSVEALGSPWAQGRWWWTSPSPAPWIYFTAILLHLPRDQRELAAAVDDLAAHLDDPAGSYEAVCDSFGCLDLGPIGLARRMPGLWYARPPGPAPRDSRSGDIVITEALDGRDLAEYERVACAAFGSPQPLTPFDIHSPGILADPAMHVLLGRSDGDVVAVAMAYVADGVLGIYGVGTLGGHRGHGHASALTGACLDLEPMLPAALQPSGEATHLYRRLGFHEVGRFSHWG